jgi:hypothetical protein
VSAQDNPPNIEELYERLRRAEAAARRAGWVGTALRIVFFVIWLSILWSCRDGCSENAWFLVGVYPLFVAYYLVERRRAFRRILSEMPEYQEALALAEKQKERERGRVE